MAKCQKCGGLVGALDGCWCAVKLPEKGYVPPEDFPWEKTQYYATHNSGTIGNTELGLSYLKKYQCTTRISNSILYGATNYRSMIFSTIPYYHGDERKSGFWTFGETSDLKGYFERIKL